MIITKIITLITVLVMIVLLHNDQVWAAVLSSILAFPVFYW